MEAKEPTALSLEKTMELLDDLEGNWQIVDGKLERDFEFKDFKEAMSFVNKIAEIAEKQGHHPDICIFYKNVKISVFTHRIKALSKDDFSLAKKINEILIN